MTICVGSQSAALPLPCGVGTHHGSLTTHGDLASALSMPPGATEMNRITDLLEPASFQQAAPPAPKRQKIDNGGGSGFGSLGGGGANEHHHFLSLPHSASATNVYEYTPPLSGLQQHHFVSFQPHGGISVTKAQAQAHAHAQAQAHAQLEERWIASAIGGGNFPQSLSSGSAHVHSGYEANHHPLPKAYANLVDEKHEQHWEPSPIAQHGSHLPSSLSHASHQSYQGHHSGSLDTGNEFDVNPLPASFKATAADHQWASSSPNPGHAPAEEGGNGVTSTGDVDRHGHGAGQGTTVQINLLPPFQNPTTICTDGDGNDGKGNVWADREPLSVGKSRVPPSIKPSVAAILRGTSTPPVSPSSTASSSAPGSGGNKKLEGKWGTRLEELRYYKHRYGDCLVPDGFHANRKLARWVREQRGQYRLLMEGRPSHMTKERVDALNELGFAWSLRGKVDWMDRFQQLVEYKCVQGDTLVPTNYAPNKQLGTWVANQRKHFKLMKEGKPSMMTQERVSMLERLGFTWSIRPWGKNKSPPSSP